MHSISGTILNELKTQLESERTGNNWPGITAASGLGTHPHLTKSTADYSFNPLKERKGLEDKLELRYFPLSGNITWLSSSKKYIEGEYPVIFRVTFPVDEDYINNQDNISKLVGICEYFQARSVIGNENPTSINGINWNYWWDRMEPVKSEEGNVIPPYQTIDILKSNMFTHYTKIVFKVRQTYLT